MRCTLRQSTFQIHTKYILTLETDMERLFETNVNQATIGLQTSADASIMFMSAPYIMYEQFKLDGSF